ncbi:heat stress transcription factor A-6b-like [Nicotiana tomentosiformis]|uniref:heat stress transcription factor A-6b-like n=1 Tax=Nicotiana tomentosiformis TaxID=4098 RepID=UPI00388C38AB
MPKINGEIDRLRREKQVLMMELVKLRQQQQTTKSYIKAMEEKLKRTEQKQQQMMEQKERRKEQIDDEIRKKRMRPIDQSPSNNVGIIELGHGVNDGNFNIKQEPQEYYGEIYGFGDFELERLAMSMQGPSGNTICIEDYTIEKEDIGELESEHKAIDEGFWEDLLYENVEDDITVLGIEEKDEDVDVLAQQLGFLGSRPK